jgi:hypothetical protein
VNDEAGRRRYLTDNGSGRADDGPYPDAVGQRSVDQAGAAGPGE